MSPPPGDPPPDIDLTTGDRPRGRHHGLRASTATLPVTVDVHLGPDDLADALRADVRVGLTAHPKELPPKWFYDERGSELFDQITRLPEYYPTRCEREILRREAETVARRSWATTVVELGSGTSEKTLALLDAFTGTGQLHRFVPFDVCDEFLRAAATDIAVRYPGLDVHGIVGDFEHHLGHVRDIPDTGPRLVVFLGGTIGNLVPAVRSTFLATLAAQLRPGDSLLLGTDLVKDTDRLVRAYDDAAGVTAEFNRNVLYVLNRELGGTFDPERFDHVALWNEDEEWIEMRLQSSTDQRVEIAALDLDVGFAEGEEVRTEISAKFTCGRVETELAEAGFELAEWWTDEAGDFAVSLSFVD